MDRKLKPGDRLPSELEISEGLCVSRGSVREAMKILAAFGLIDIRVGNGTYVCESIGNGMMDSFLFSFFLSNPDVENLFELRRFFEIDIMELIDKHYLENEEMCIRDRYNRSAYMIFLISRNQLFLCLFLIKNNILTQMGM